MTSKLLLLLPLLEIPASATPLVLALGCASLTEKWDLQGFSLHFPDGNDVKHFLPACFFDWKICFLVPSFYSSFYFLHTKPHPHLKYSWQRFFSRPIGCLFTLVLFPLLCEVFHFHVILSVSLWSYILLESLGKVLLRPVSYSVFQSWRDGSRWAYWLPCRGPEFDCWTLCQVTAVSCESSFRWSDTIFWPLWAPTNMYVRTYT